MLWRAKERSPKDPVSKVALHMKILSDYEGGDSIRSISRKYYIPYTTVRSIIDRHKRLKGREVT